MLYYPFRKSLEILVSSMAGVLKYGAPDTDESVSADVEEFLLSLHNKLNTLAALTQRLPVELEGHPNRDFGPVVDPNDLRKVLSLIMPLADSLDNQCPVLSYFPVRLYRDKSLILLETMNLYCEWKEYFKNPDKLIVQEFMIFVSDNLTTEEHMLPLDSMKLDILFKNIFHSSKHAQRDINSEFNKAYEKI
ncbi:hypothetical protein [Enterovibrio norvegicus]|uniref:Uncharacterized protein n=1 Tax=Enterovibrio norvegicus TaxID=188144 RepID=A0A2N7LH75_9GAMM|nr:hypothetical protein [Enterovibrio norvegicus]PMN94897.1 hypothetical protein BCT23_02370 [Enterovibrio norvegicus]